MSPSACINFHKLLLEYFTLYIFIISFYILLKCLIMIILHYFYKIKLRICVFTRRSRLAALLPAAGGAAAAPGSTRPSLPGQVPGAVMPEYHISEISLF